MRAQSAVAVGARHSVPYAEGDQKGAGGAQAGQVSNGSYVITFAVNDGG